MIYGPCAMAEVADANSKKAETIVFLFIMFLLVDKLTS